MSSPEKRSDLRRLWPLWLAMALIFPTLLFLAVRFDVRARAFQLLRNAPEVELTFQVDVAHPYQAGLTEAELVRRDAETVRQRLRDLGLVTTVDTLGAQLRVRVATTAAGLPRILTALQRPGRLDIKVVDDGTRFMAYVGVELGRHPQPGVAAGEDLWTERDSGLPHHDDYLWATDRQPLEAALATLRPDDEHELVIGARPRVQGGGLRSYYVFRTVELSAAQIADVEAVDGDGRIELSVHFDKDGAQRLADVSERVTGHKLAIIIDDFVASAPVVESKLLGGNARITLGDVDSHADAVQQAKELVASFGDYGSQSGLVAPLRQVVSAQSPRVP